MSAKLVLITARNPYCVRAQGACSRLLPHPKLSPARRIWDRLGFWRVQDEIRFGLAFGVVTPVKEKLIAEAVLRNRLQESGGNDLVGIDVVDGERDQAAFEG